MDMSNLESETTLLLTIFDAIVKPKIIHNNMKQHIIFIPEKRTLSALDEMFSNLIYNIKTKKIKNLVINGNKKYINDVRIYCKDIDIDIYYYDAYSSSQLSPIVPS